MITTEDVDIELLSGVAYGRTTECSRRWWRRAIAAASYLLREWRVPLMDVLIGFTHRLVARCLGMLGANSIFECLQSPPSTKSMEQVACCWRVQWAMLSPRQSTNGCFFLLKLKSGSSLDVSTLNSQRLLGYYRTRRWPWRRFVSENVIISIPQTADPSSVINSHDTIYLSIYLFMQILWTLLIAM